MRITSPAFVDDTQIPVTFTIDGTSAFVPLEFAEVPTEAVSLVLIIDDPDCPPERVPNGLFDHWLVWNMPTDCSGVPTEADVVGVLGRNGRGATNYVTPSPPVGHGEHRYYFKLYAMDCLIDLPELATRAELLAAMDGHVIAEAVLMGRYTRRG